MTQDARFEKIGELSGQVDVLVDLVKAFREYVEPDFEAKFFHRHYDPMVAAAEKAHDVYHELLHLQSHEG